MEAAERELLDRVLAIHDVLHTAGAVHRLPVDLDDLYSICHTCTTMHWCDTGRHKLLTDVAPLLAVGTNRLPAYRPSARRGNLHTHTHDRRLYMAPQSTLLTRPMSCPHAFVMMLVVDAALDAFHCAVVSCSLRQTHVNVNVNNLLAISMCIRDDVKADVSAAQHELGSWWACNA